MKLSQRARRVQPSATLAVSTKAKSMRADGIDVVNFSAGEPDFPTPEPICEAARQAIANGFTKYTPTPGIPELRAAICKRFKEDYGFSVLPEQVVVSCGAKHSIYLALAALVDPGDEVLIPAPYWVSYPPQVELCDGVPVIVETTPENGFRMTPDDLRQALTPRSRVLILNSPSNPTGQLYSRAEMEALAEVVLEAGLMVICDDIYEKLIYDSREFVSLSQISDAVRTQCIVTNGVSKCASMTGWRIGYLAAEPELAKAVTRLQGQMTSHPTSIAQYAAVEALGQPLPQLGEWVAAFQTRRDRMVELLNNIEGVRCESPPGAFYCFADWRGLLDRKTEGKALDGDMEWAEYLLDAAQTACVPGSPFGAPGFLRFSFACGLDRIEDGLARVKKAVEQTR